MPDEAGAACVTVFHGAGQKWIQMSADGVNATEEEHGRDSLEAKLKGLLLSRIFKVAVRARVDGCQGENRRQLSCVAAEPLD